ncbi:hypothetical protein ACM01_14775 [Streptomyces viridochromogenes]|uniref:Uncharacterized protein n=1 Tax=Streptomyces viridochromogenes TaxID=1938 RepID=A0A0J7ZDM6_STRVR|nr:hypothetical protein [Streptomyces viridochromogenes]KMS74186.1 hypothetical protein ACM01_14775 [Streptomyces viridochromogenes]
MYPAAIRDPAIGSHTPPAPGQLMRWTLPATPALGDQVRTVVTAAYDEWATPPHQVDTLADLAADYAEQAAQEAAEYVTVTVTLEGARATVSAIRAAAPAPDHSAELRLYEEPTEESSGGTRTLAAGRLHHASVNLGVRRPLRGARRTITHRYLTTDPDAPERAGFNVGLSLGMWGVPMPIVAELAETAGALVADAAAAGAVGEILVFSVLNLHDLQAAVHAVTLACRTPHSAVLADVVDPVTAACVREAAGMEGDQGCPCVALALPGPNLRRGHYIPNAARELPADSR